MVEGETLPTFDQLESKSSSSLVDKKGSRYHIGHQNIVWETTEVISLQATQSLLFPPSWYHRIIPPKKDNDSRGTTTTTAITLVAKYRMDPIVANGSQRRKVNKQSTYMVMKPNELVANTTTKHSCYHIIHVIQSMLQHQPSFTKKGIALPSCHHSIQKDKLFPMNKVGNLKQYYKQMIQTSQQHPPNTNNDEL